MKRIASYFSVGIVAFAMGVCLSLLYSALRSIRGEIPPIATEDSQRTTPSLVVADSPIRSIDFKNFTYPRVGEQRSYIQHKTFTLTDGEYAEHEIEDGMNFGDVIYGDATGDGNEEAIVVLGVQTRGSAIPNCVYVYTLKHNEPRLLWGFLTGDRADGGLRHIAAEKGVLTIELYGKGTRVERKLYSSEPGVADCCAMSVTRTHYRWYASRFRQEGECEVFHNPADNSSYLD
jgi:hypothetical protein